MQCSYVQDALSKKTVKTWVFYGKAILNCDSGTILAQGSILIGHCYNYCTKFEILGFSLLKYIVMP